MGDGALCYGALEIVGLLLLLSTPHPTKQYTTKHCKGKGV